MRKLKEREKEIRRKRAEREDFTIKPLDVTESSIKEASLVGALFEVKGNSDKSYEVSLRHLDSPANYCTCPDFATNTLATCKHLEAAKLDLSLEAPELYENMKESAEKTDFPPINLVYLDHTSSPPVVRCHIEEKNKENKTICEEVFGKKNQLTLTKMRKGFPGFLKRAKSLGFKITPEAISFVKKTLEKARLDKEAKKIAKSFEKDLKKKPDKKAEAGEKQIPHYVAQGAHFLIENRRGLIMDETGLDRMRQALLATEHIIKVSDDAPSSKKTDRKDKSDKPLSDLPEQNPVPCRLFIFCPEAKITSWRDLIAEHLVSTPFVFKAPATKENTAKLAKARFVVSEYKDVPALVSTLDITPDDILILDDIHRLRNWQGSGGAAIKSVNCNYVFALSSPRLLKNPKQIFYLVQYLDPYLLGPSWEFFERHFVKDERGAIIETQHLDEIQKKLENIALKRSLAEVRNDLEDVISIEMGVLPTTAQMKKMNPVLESFVTKLNSIGEWGPADRATIVAQAARLRKLCDFIEPGMSGQASPKGKALLQLLEDIREEAGPFSFIIFTRFRDIAARLASILQEWGYPTVGITRTTSKEDTAKAIEDFNQELLSGIVVTDEILHEIEPLNGSVIIDLDVPWSPVTYEERRRIGRFEETQGIKLQLLLYLTNSIEEMVKRNQPPHEEELASLISDTSMELEALPSQGSGPLSRIMELLLDRVALQALLPTRPQARKKRDAGGGGVKKARTRAGGVQPKKEKPGGGIKKKKSPARKATRGDVIVLGMTTRNPRQPGVTNSTELRRLGLGVAVTYSYANDSFTAWRQEYVNELIRNLISAQLVVGWRPSRFDYKILMAYTGLPLKKVPTIDILSEVEEALGYPIPAELITQATLEKRRRLMPDKAVTMWRNGRIRELAELIYEDVRLTRDLFSIMIRNKKLFYPKAPSGSPAPIELDITSRVPEQVISLVGKPPKRTGRKRS